METFKKLAFVFIYFLLCNNLYSKEIPGFGHQLEIKKEYRKDEYVPKYDSLLKEFGKNKILPVGYELQALIALSHFPELRDVKIRFIMKPSYIPLTSQPNLWTVFKKNREPRISGHN